MSVLIGPRFKWRLKLNIKFSKRYRPIILMTKLKYYKITYAALYRSSRYIEAGTVLNEHGRIQRGGGGRGGGQGVRTPLELPDY